MRDHLNVRYNSTANLVAAADQQESDGSGMTYRYIKDYKNAVVYPFGHGPSPSLLLVLLLLVLVLLVLLVLVLLLLLGLLLVLVLLLSRYSASLGFA